MTDQSPRCVSFEGVKLFSATKAKDRDHLGDKVTDWMNRHRQNEVVDYKVSQSSDSEFHCVTIVLFYVQKKRVNNRPARHTPNEQVV